MPPPPPPPPPRQQQQQHQVGQKRKSIQRQPSRLATNGLIGRTNAAAAAAAAAGGSGAAANGSLSGRKRQKQQPEAGDADASGLEGGRNPNLPPMAPELRGQHLVVDASHEVGVKGCLSGLHACGDHT